MNPILAGIIGGAGVGMTNIAGQLEEQRKEALKQQEIKIAQQRADQEQQYRDASLTIERDKIAEQARANASTDASRYSELEPLVKAGLLPESILSGGTTRMQTAATDQAMQQYQAQQKALQAEGQRNTAREAILNQPARPAVPMPAEGGMYSEAETLPGKAATPRNAMLAAVLGEPGAAAILDQMYGKDKVTHAPAGSAILGPNGEVLGMVPAAPKDPQFKVETVDRPDGTYQITTNTLTGESKAAKLEGVPGKPAFAPQRPEQPNASQLYISTMKEYQAARDAFGAEDPRTKNLEAIALGLRNKVDPETGRPIETPKPVDPLKAAIADMMTNKKAPGPGITPPAPPRPAPRPAATPAPATPQPPFPGAIRIVGQDGTPGWLRPGRPMPPGAQAVP
jgi:hypothetical protein